MWPTLVGRGGDADYCGGDLTSAFQRALAAVRPPDTAALARARMLHDRLIKPAGSLGRIEDLGVQLAGIAGRVPPPVPEHPAVAVFAADHGVVRSGVTPWPQEVTAQMVANFCAGGAAISVLARQHGARLVVIDVGVARHSRRTRRCSSARCGQERTTSPMGRRCQWPTRAPRSMPVPTSRTR